MKSAFAYASARISAKCLTKERRLREESVLFFLPKKFCFAKRTTPPLLRNTPPASLQANLSAEIMPVETIKMIYFAPRAQGDEFLR